MNATTRRQAIINYALLVFFCFIALFPIFGVFIASVYPSGSQPSSFKLPSHFAFHNFVTAWTQGDFSMYFRSSAIVAVSVVVLATGLSVLGGYAFGTMRFRGSKVLFYTFILGLIIPTEATIVSLYYDIRSLNLIDTWTALILVEVSGAVAFGVFWMRAAFLSAPRSLLEAARIDGASTWQIMWRIMIPFGWPAILTLMVLTFADSWNEFFLALVLTTSNQHLTAPAGLQVFSGKYVTNTPLIAAGAVIVALPVVMVFLLLQRQFIRGVLTGAVKG
ncbi:MAG: raffinose/stachyose/melibiose transport system permease protein [Actinomycetota bacterium]|jgi:raffinose/stachyose/melibiose transport system permease protein|nr:raffinose/stachyose/melibiose transport system permease protein [Actinomycetota bacterium]MEA2551332.1 raffinose/stachyose/melibiose transport system permease protein [Actinomycetota bacterium]